MLTVRIIPCLDVKDGRVVKGVNFLDLIDAGDPVEQAKIYDKEGAVKEKYNYSKMLSENYYNEPEIEKVGHQLPNTAVDKFKQSTLQLLRDKYNRERQIEAADNSKLFHALTELHNYTNKPMLADEPQNNQRRYGESG